MVPEAAQQGKGHAAHLPALLVALHSSGLFVAPFSPITVQENWCAEEEERRLYREKKGRQLRMEGKDAFEKSLEGAKQLRANLVKEVWAVWP